VVVEKVFFSFISSKTRHVALVQGCTTGRMRPSMKFMRPCTCN